MYTSTSFRHVPHTSESGCYTRKILGAFVCRMPLRYSACRMLLRYSACRVSDQNGDSQTCTYKFVSDHRPRHICWSPTDQTARLSPERGCISVQLPGASTGQVLVNNTGTHQKGVVIHHCSGAVAGLLVTINSSRSTCKDRRMPCSHRMYCRASGRFGLTQPEDSFRSISQS